MHTLDELERHLIELVQGYLATLSRDGGPPTGFDRARFDELAAMDLTALALPSHVDGTDVSLRTTTVVVEELARGIPALGAGLAAHLTGALAAHDAGDAALTSVAATGAGVLTLGVPGGAGDGLALVRLQAGRRGRADADHQPPGGDQQRGEDAALHGVLAGVVLAPLADHLVVSAVDADGVRHLLRLEAGAVPIADGHGDGDEGVAVGLPVADVVVDTGRLDPGCLLASGGAADAAATTAIDVSRILFGACAVGVAEAALDAVILALADRLVDVDDAVARRELAEASIRTEAAKTLVRSAAERRDHAQGIGPHRATPDAGGGYRFSRAAAAARVTAVAAARAALTCADDLAGAVYRPRLDELGGVLAVLARVTGTAPSLIDEVGRDVWSVRGLP